MPARPYREPAPIEPDPPPDPAAALARLGNRCSMHAPPPLHRALVGPALIAAVIGGVGFAADGPAAVVLAVAAASFVILAWSPLRLRGFSAALHARGLVLSRRGARSAVLFEDVNEIWLEIDALHSQSGAYLRALRLVDFSGSIHHVPLAVNDAAVLAKAVFHGCSGPLLTDARQALEEGTTLDFGRIQIDREGITVGGARCAWPEIRRATVSHGKVLLYRRWPILAWRTAALDRIPNPAVFVGLVMANVATVRCDDLLLVPLASEPSMSAAIAAEDVRQLAMQTMLAGGGFFALGAAIACVAYSMNSAVLAIGYPPMIFGAVRFFQGLTSYISSPRR